MEHRVEENTVAHLSFFQQMQHLRSDPLTTSPRDFTVKMAHQTTSCAKGKRPSERGGGEGDGWTPGEMLTVLEKVWQGR